MTKLKSARRRFRGAWRFFGVLVMFLAARSLPSEASGQTPPRYTLSSGSRVVVPIGGSTELSVVADGATRFQWVKDGFPIPGATSSRYPIVGAYPSVHTGRYQVRIFADGISSSVSVLSRSIFLYCASAEAPRLHVFGSNSHGQMEVPTGIKSVVAVSAGDRHSLALLPDGNVVAWGDNSFGQCSVPSTLRGVVAIAAGGNLSMAIDSDGRVVVWGDPFWGTNQVPSGLPPVASIETQSGTCAAVTDDGQLVIWGRNTQAPYLIPQELSRVVSVALGDRHMIALRDDGRAFPWGLNDTGQLGNPMDLSDLRSVGATYLGSFAIRADGSAYIWGFNSTRDRAVLTATSRWRSISGHYELMAIDQADVPHVLGPPGFPTGRMSPGPGRAYSVSAGYQHYLLLYDPAEDRPPRIISQPTSQVLATGGSGVLSVAVTPEFPPPLFQWRKNGVPIAGATSSRFRIAAASTPERSSYDVQVSNHLGAVVSEPASVSVDHPSAATIRSQTGAGPIAFGATLTLNTEVAGVPSPRVAWYFNGQAIPGATQAQLVIPSASKNNSGNYYAIASNEANGVSLGLP